MDIPPAPQLTTIGNIEPICPNCETDLPEPELEKFLCPNCLGLIYWIPRPMDGQRVFASEIVADEIFRQRWALDGEYHTKMTLKLAEDARFESERERLRTKTGSLPDSSSIRIYTLFQDMESQRNMGNWRTYSDTLQRVGIMSTRNGKYRDALIWFFENIFIDLHGPEDLNGIEPSQDSPPFNRRNPRLIDESLQMAMQVAAKGRISEEEMRDCFYQATTAGEKYIPQPMFPIEAWRIIKEKLEMAG